MLEIVLDADEEWDSSRSWEPLVRRAAEAAIAESAFPQLARSKRPVELSVRLAGDDEVRALNAQFPDKYTTPLLAERFKVSPEAIRRILKSKWRPSDEEAKKRQNRWEKRGEKIWGKMVELGVKPPKKWREMGVGKSKAEDPRSGRQGWSERGLRKLWNADNIGEEKANHYDWDEETLAERIL